MLTDVKFLEASVGLGRVLVGPHHNCVSFTQRFSGRQMDVRVLYYHLQGWNVLDVFVLVFLSNPLVCNKINKLGLRSRHMFFSVHYF